MADVEVRGVRFHVERLRPPGGGGARGPAVVFVHGALSSMAMFYYTVANHVALAGYDAVLYDLRGHGLSEGPPRGYLVEDMVADLAALLAAVEPGRPVHLVGYSLGGTIAQCLTVARPDLVASLILVEGLVRPRPHAHRSVIERSPAVDEVDTLGRLADELIAEMIAANVGGGPRWAAKTRRLLTQTTIHADLSKPDFRDEETAPLITRPTLVLCGDRSDFFAEAGHAARLIPDCVVGVLPGCDHLNVLYEGGPAVREQVIAWLDGYPMRRAAERNGKSRCLGSCSSYPR
jgi:pimeloyl-ACP methyl ester carboxylesterase